MKHYLVYVGTWDFESFFTKEKFVTDNKEYAEYWVNKFNRIIDNNAERIMCNFDDEGTRKILLWEAFIVLDKPIAGYKEIEFREGNKIINQ